VLEPTSSTPSRTRGHATPGLPFRCRTCSRGRAR
jgi:hypothetical protein